MAPAAFNRLFNVAPDNHQNLIPEMVDRANVQRVEKSFRSQRCFGANSSGPCPMDYGSLSGLWAASFTIILLRLKYSRINISYSLEKSQTNYRRRDRRNDPVLFSPFSYPSFVRPKFKTLINWKLMNFLIFSNMRSGSTWLQTMLAQLSDVVADYELKWKPNFELDELHVPIYNCKFMLDEFFQNMPNFPIKGTKLTFDFLMIDEECYEIVNWLPSKVGIIHLTRNYYDILNSFYRGVFHNYKTSNSLKHKSPVIHKALLRSKSDYSNAVSIPINERKRLIDINEAKKQLNVFLSVDKCANKLSLRNPYIRIDYTKIKRDFKKIIKFIGSTENNSRIKEILENPLTKRLPSEQIIINKQKIRQVSNSFEKKKVRAIKKFL